MDALHIHIDGAVQGVGFRPFIYRLATELGLKGFVRNDGRGVDITVEGNRETLETFLLRISNEKPPRAVIYSIEYKWIPSNGYKQFEILQSSNVIGLQVWMLPDIATCSDCLDEIFDPENRRYLYPFTNCTNCGPRYSIIKALPYDRKNTTMASFTMCPACQAEYTNPMDRRYHAQPNACPECGPKVFLTDSAGKIISERADAIQDMVRLIQEGKIIALKGIGGFQLIADATRDDVVKSLRERKKRPQKPFALMAADLSMVEKMVKVNPQERFWLQSPEAPIVILERLENPEIKVSEYVAPENPTLGVMLPYTPLHHILMRLIQRPLIATSGNLSEEPLCYDNEEALDRLGDIADFFLMNDRPIVHPVDDSVLRIVNGKPLMIRRARGFAPLPFEMEEHIPEVLAVGGHLKDTIAVTRKKMLFVSQHIGDLDNAETMKHFKAIQNQLLNVYRIKPECILHDRHPDYNSTKFVKEHYKEIPHCGIQHHTAHLFSVMAEHRIPLPVLGIIWDGTGYGDDGTIWGGEWFRLNHDGVTRVATFYPFKLPGGEKAIYQPWRTALGLLYEAGVSNIPENLSSRIPEKSRKLIQQMLDKDIQCVPTTSAGRLFDGISAICGLCFENTYEGEAAIKLEHMATKNWFHESAYPFHLNTENGTGLLLVDWRPMIEAICKDIYDKVQIPIIAGRFHRTLLDIMLSVAIKMDERHIIISGGCFQNRILVEGIEKMAAQNSLIVFRPQMIPPNDGCISVGQVMVYQWHHCKKEEGSIHVSGRSG